MSPANQPLYFVPANHPFVTQWQPLFQQFSKPDIHTFTFTVNPDVIDTQDVASVQQLGFAIQHQHHFARVKHHRQRLTAALRMPNHPRFSVALGLVFNAHHAITFG